MKRALVLAGLLAGCGTATTQDAGANAAGARLEQAAVAEGLVIDPARATIVGAWARDTDRLCIVPLDGGTARIGATIDLGPDHRCAARGEVTRRGNRLAVRFGACRFDATFEGDRIAFPAELPGECDRYCIGRASLAAFAVERVSASVSEAQTLRTPGGAALCGN